MSQRKRPEDLRSHRWLGVNGLRVDVLARRIHLHVPEEELARRRAAWKQSSALYPRGYGAIHSEHIGQADAGSDFDFLAPLGDIREPEIH
jgi:hypothetical protein